MARPLQHVHREQRRIGHLQEEDLSPGIVGDAARVVLQRQRVEAVEDQARGADGRRAARSSQAWPYSVDVAAPGQRLVADAQVAPRRALGQLVQLRGRAFRVVEWPCGEVFEHTSISGAPSACIRSNLRSARSRLRRNCGVRHALEIAERLVQVDREAEVGRDRAAARRPLPLKWMKSFSNSSTPSKRAAAMASSFCAQRAAQRHGGDRPCAWVSPDAVVAQ